MIISDHKKFMFLHNPKAAGTSIRTALFEHDTNPYRLEYQKFVPMLDRVIELFHVPAADIHSVWPELDLKNYFTFGFVRNPYDRLFSAWDEYRRQHPEMLHANFNEWAITHLTRANVRYDWEFTHFCPQHYFFYIGKKCIADFIGRHENMHQDWHTACRLARVEHKPLDHKKQHGSYNLPNRLTLKDLEPEVLQRVNDIYEMDFWYFGYRNSMKGGLTPKTRHLDIIERNSHPHRKYSAEEDIRTMSVPEQCGYWRQRAQDAEALWEIYTQHNMKP